MKIIYSSQDGSILVIAVIIFFISSAIGMAILSLSALSTSELVDVVDNNEMKYAVESVLNKALWRINSGPDTLGNFVDGGITSVYVDSTMILTVTGVSRGDTHQVVVELEPDFHFQRSVGYQDWFDVKRNRTFTELTDHVTRQFDFMPTLDTAYFAQNAVQTYDDDVYLNSTLTSGIHYSRSGECEIGRNFYLEGCLVVLENIRIRSQSGPTLIAITDTAGIFLPALITNNISDKVDLNRMDVTGAICAAGEIEYDRTQSDLTGPLVGYRVDINNDLNLNNPAYESYYVWPSGFGDFNSYDWPKQIKMGTWK